MAQQQINIPIQPTSCACCRQAHSACDKKRPCARCIKFGKVCVDVVKGPNYKRRRSESLPAKKHQRLTAKLSLPSAAVVIHEDPETYDPDSLLRDSVDPKVIECPVGKVIKMPVISPKPMDYTFEQSQVPGSVIPLGTAGVLGCHNCRISHVSCDKGRPCVRCVRLGATHLCVDPAVGKKMFTKSRSLPPKEEQCSHLNIDSNHQEEEPFCFRMSQSEIMEEAQQLGLKVQKDPSFITIQKQRIEETDAYPTPVGTPPPVSDLDFLVSEDEFPIYLTVQS